MGSKQSYYNSYSCIWCSISNAGMAVLSHWEKESAWITWHCPVPFTLAVAAGVTQGISLLTFTVHL